MYSDLVLKGFFMGKKEFIALADKLQMHNRMNTGTPAEFNNDHLNVLASFCQSQNYAFKRERWFSYIKGECGPSGGKVK